MLIATNFFDITPGDLRQWAAMGASSQWPILLYYGAICLLLPEEDLFYCKPIIPEIYPIILCKTFLIYHLLCAILHRVNFPCTYLFQKGFLIK
jgi:hypothetical protein